MQWMTALIESDNWEEIVGRCHAHGGTEFSIGSYIPSKYMNQGKLSGSSFPQKSLPYWPNHFSLTIHSGSHGLGPWVTKIILSFVGFLIAFCWKSEHTSWFFHVLAKVLFSRFKRTHQGPRVLKLFLLHILWSRSLLHVLWPRSSSSFFIIISFFFLLFGTLGLLLLRPMVFPYLSWNGLSCEILSLNTHRLELEYK